MDPIKKTKNPMKLFKIALLFLLGLPTATFAQDEEELLNQMLTGTVENENPVYIPVIGVGMGYLNFYGEVHNKHQNIVSGKPAYKLNVATYIDNQHYYRANFFLIKGNLSGENRSKDDTAKNLNFSTDIMSFGVNFHYDFRNIIKKSNVRPFISLGIEDMQFSSKGDLYYNDNGVMKPYHYWSDGTIRDIDESLQNIAQSHIIQRDNIYETDLRKANRWGLGNYAQSTFAIPIDFGIDFTISDRINLRVGYSLHYTFTDNLDNISSKISNPSVKGNKRNDMFSFTYFTLHWDLFSESRFIEYQKAIADIDGYDYDMLADGDYDGIKDLVDKCPNTPEGVEVDSTGCPLDGDADGVPNYLDKELNTPSREMVDQSGVTINPDDLAARLSMEGLRRKDVDAYLQMRRAQSRTGGRPSKPIPAKFKSVDEDGDGYVSFDELLKAINNYFDFSSDLSTKDLYELQDFFFEQ
jgi:hypothetical protein